MTVGKDVVLMVAALADSWGIGYQQDLPWHIPADWEYLERITSKAYGTVKDDAKLDDALWHNVVIMGRLSWESVPMKRIPMKNRYNIVVSRNQQYNVHAVKHFPTAELSTSIHHAVQRAKALVPPTGRVFILGGGQIYDEAMKHPDCTHILLTRIHAAHILCDAFMSPIDLTQFRLATHEELEAFVNESVPAGLQTHDSFRYEFLLYLRIYPSTNGTNSNNNHDTLEDLSKNTLSMSPFSQ